MKVVIVPGVSYTIAGLGHLGGYYGLIATDIIWDFFTRHPKQ